MAKIKKYQMGGTPVKKYPGTNPKKIDTTKKAPYYDLRDDYKEPGAKKRESEMIKELKKKPAMPASKKNVGRKGIKVKKAKNGKSFPDLNKDGKITKADILKGRGVIKNGGKMKKAAFGMIATTTPMQRRARAASAINRTAAAKNAARKRQSRAASALGKMRMGGKCKYGC